MDRAAILKRHRTAVRHQRELDEVLAGLRGAAAALKVLTGTAG